MSSRMNIANLYSGIGGNRKLWGDTHNITAVEINPKIADVYKKLYPNDTVIVGDAHQFLLEHFREFDFIWASPPCPTHSILQWTRTYEKNLKYPDMTLYQEIILLQHFYRGKYVIENVIPYYEPLIQPTFKIDRHYFWSSDFILTNQFLNDYDGMRDKSQLMADAYNIDMSLLKGVNKRTVLRNCVVPEIGKYIFESLTGGANVK